MKHPPNTPRTILFRLNGAPVKVDFGHLLVTLSNVTPIPARQFVIIDADTTADIALPNPPLTKLCAQVDQHVYGYAKTFKRVCRSFRTNTDTAAPINIP